jgi:hypothetical protein
MNRVLYPILAIVLTLSVGVFVYVRHSSSNVSDPFEIARYADGVLIAQRTTRTVHGDYLIYWTPNGGSSDMISSSLDAIPPFDRLDDGTFWFIERLDRSDKRHLRFVLPDGAQIPVLCESQAEAHRQVLQRINSSQASLDLSTDMEHK